MKSNLLKLLRLKIRFFSGRCRAHLHGSNCLLQTSFYLASYLSSPPLTTPLPAIHAVDELHNGSSDSSVLYIPVCPLTLPNAYYLARQRAAFLAGTPGPDFPGGKGESAHIGRPTEDFVRENCSLEGRLAFGLEKWDTEGIESELSGGQKKVLRAANKVLGFGS